MGELSKEQVMYLIGESKKWLGSGLDELQEYMENTPRGKIICRVKQYYNDYETIAYQCYHSSKLGGSRTTLKDTNNILRNMKYVSGLYSINDYENVKGFTRALRKSIILCKKNGINSDSIRDLHYNLMCTHEPKIAGKFRSCGATIYGHEDVMFAKSGNIEPMLNNICEEYIFSSKPDLLRACEFKGKFINIHPFSDGNGRLSRLILNCMLISGGMLPIVIRDGERLGYKRAMYVNYLTKGKNGGLYPLLEIVVRDLLREYREIGDI